jgi:TonB family protein
LKQDCARAEILAGAIAVGEASTAEREAYRLHVASCAACLEELGGEREIERVMEAVAQARDAEVWEPALVGVTRSRRGRQPILRAGLSLLGVAVIGSVAAHFALAFVVRPVTLAQVPAPSDPATFHVTLEHRAPEAAARGARRAQPQTQPQILVVHNVITLKREGRAAAKPATQSQQTTVVAEATAAPPRDEAAPNVPIWRRDAPLPDARATAVPVLSGHAESIAIANPPVVRDAAPLGGVTAINPQPPPIAYLQGAEGTTAFEVSIDERGTPVRCTITKSSGFLSLDNAVCRAAMRARFQPRTVNGRATPGVYRDAFTFHRANDDQDGQL